MAIFIKLSTLEYPRHPGDIAIDPAGEADYAEVAWVDPPVVTANQVAFETHPVKEGDQWVMQWSVRDLTPEEIEARTPPVMRNSEPPDAFPA